MLKIGNKGAESSAFVSSFSQVSDFFLHFTPDIRTGQAEGKLRFIFQPHLW